jgi:hypothetical protein
MLVTFRSTATESITMFHDVAVELIKMMGASGRVPSALSPEEVAAAAARLRAALQRVPRPADQNDDDDDDERDTQPAIGLATRAVPLLDLLDRAAGHNAEVMWELR